MTEVSALAQVVRSWQLPLPSDAEDLALDAVTNLATGRAMSIDDFAIVLDHQTDTWRTTDTVGPDLRAAMTAALATTPTSNASIDARAYFAMYERLRRGTSDVAGLSQSVSRRLLSRTTLIAHLLGEERFSCSQVARLLAATEASLDVPYGAVQVIARELGMLPTLDRDAAGQILWGADQALSLALFPDSSLAETCEIAAAEVEVWLPEVDVATLLNRLAKSDRPDGEPTWPYLQILHWCLTPVEFYDHPASFLYEFAPRGQVGLALFGRYPTVTGNPVLNNAKAVETLNSTWARNRGGDDAHALVAILGTIESLPYVPRRQVARVLRAWLTRVIELRTVTPVLLNPEMTPVIVERLIDYIITTETNTQGVIEQRAVDCLATLVFDKPGWRSRGLGDGVNASNLSRHKLGDVEFTKVDDRIAIALEAHGGHLSATYVADHQRSLARVVNQRLSESWSLLDDPENWTIRVIFVAHSRDASGLPTTETLHGVHVEYEYMDYEDLVSLMSINSTTDDQVAAFELYVVDALNKSNVRESARERFRQIVVEVDLPVDPL